MMMNGAGSLGLLMPLLMLAALVALVLGGVWLYRRVAAPSPDRRALDPAAAPSGDPALRRLRERYAAGEIDDQEYERRLSALTYWS
jgi:putative membrane protein